MNRVGLKDYLLNHADDNDLLDCAKAWDAANEYGQFDTYKSVEEAAEVNGWDAAQALGEAARVDLDADNFRLNGYAHLESVSDAELLETARDSIDDIVNWLEYANRYDLEDISSDIELFVDAKDSFEIINEVDCSVCSNGDAIEVNLKRGCDEAALLSGADVVSTQSVPELLDTMADRFGIEPEERTHIATPAKTKEHARTHVPDIGVEIDSYNDDNFITGTVTVDGESCYFNCPNSTRNPNDYDSVILEPFRPDGFEGDIEDVELPAAIDENRDIVEMVVSVAVAPYMDPSKLPGCEQSLDSLCEEKNDEAQSMRYGMEGVGLPMLDAAEHLANY